MKKLLVCLLAMALLLSGCACAQETSRKTDFPDHTFEPMDPYYITGVTQRGKTVMFRYDAQTADGQDYAKSALVYLPYGFDPEDTATRYNVFYLMHGGGEGYTTFLKGVGQVSNLQFVLDAMIEKGRVKPFIVVTPTFRIPDKDETWCAQNFWYELNNYLIPAFESAYPTYAMDVTPKGIHASRTHRAFGGFSMGALTTWHVFGHSLDQIAYYMPFSGDSWNGSTSLDKAKNLAKQVADAGYTKDDFFIYAGCGGEGDIAYKGMTTMVEAMQQLTDTFVFCDNFRDGNLYYTQCSGGHSHKTVELIMYAGLPTFFDE